jgi:hypothetical protein
LSVEDGCVVVTTAERVVKIPYSQAKAPAEVNIPAAAAAAAAGVVLFEQQQKQQQQQQLLG